MNDTTESRVLLARLREVGDIAPKDTIDIAERMNDLPREDRLLSWSSSDLSVLENTSNNVGCATVPDVDLHIADVVGIEDRTRDSLKSILTNGIPRSAASEYARSAATVALLLLFDGVKSTRSSSGDSEYFSMELIDDEG